MAIGRNDPCPCGSGKKSKKCCGQEKTSASDLERAMALYQEGRYLELESLAHRMVQVTPGDGNAWKTLGIASHLLGKDAIPALEKAAGLLPQDAEIHNNLAVTLEAAGRLKQACESYVHAISIAPNYPEAYSNLGNALQKRGLHEEAIGCYRKAVDLKPGCAKSLSNLLYYLTQYDGVAPQALREEHEAFSSRFENPGRWPKHSNRKDPERPLRIGFVSADLRSHPVATYFEPVLAELARSPQLVLHVYSNSPVEDEVTARIRTHAASWNQVSGWTDSALQDKILSDGIDILIDLSGHTGGNRLSLFVSKPAPVQASWLGYPATTGLRAMDYYLADAHFLPLEGFSQQFTEHLVHLPANAPFQGPIQAPEVNLLPATHQPLTLGSFNSLGKVRRPVVALWGEVLRALPQSRMLIAGMPEEGSFERLLEWFAAEQIDRGRLEFQRRCDMTSYLQMHHRVDLCLDTFPYTGATTTCLALWMGVPTVTLAGATGAGRPGAAVMGHLGLDNFIAYSQAEFVHHALDWADHLGELGELRKTLRQRFQACALGRPDLIAQGLEQALREMWQRWCRGEDASPIQVKDYAKR